MSGPPAEELYELRTTSAVRRALSESLPEAVAVAAYEFITGPLLREPHRVGKRLLPPIPVSDTCRRIIRNPGRPTRCDMTSAAG